MAEAPRLEPQGASGGGGSAAPILDCDVLVVGGGLAGAMAALSARSAGARVALARRSPGATALSSGAISAGPDLGALPRSPLAARAGPAEAARRIAQLRPDHPYAVLGDGLAHLPAALEFAAHELASILAPFTGRTRWLGTPFGVARPCALCQRTMVACDLAEVRGMLAVVGLRGHLRWDAGLVASGLGRLGSLGGPRTSAVQIDVFMWEDAVLSRPHEMAAFLERPGVAEGLGTMLRRALPAGASAVLFPPVLGLAAASRVAERISATAGIPVAEMLSDVPSVPGLRLQQAIDSRLRAAGVELLCGDVREGHGPGEPALCAGRTIRARSWVLATGRFVGGGIVRRGVLVEPLLGVPVTATEGPLREPSAHLATRPAASLTHRESSAPQPLLAAGLSVDAMLRPLGAGGRPFHERLFAAGAVIGGHDQATDGTGLGVAVLTGYLAGRSAASGQLVSVARGALA
jgi:glycerol-3-phosphate dehydrogenase subunit B